MNVIYKYPLTLETPQTLVLPIGSKVLSVQAQNGVPTVWVLQQEGEAVATTEVLVAVIATGESFEIENWNYIDTVQIGEFVWHVFMRE